MNNILSSITKDTRYGSMYWDKSLMDFEYLLKNQDLLGIPGKYLIRDGLGFVTPDLPFFTIKNSTQKQKNYIQFQRQLTTGFKDNQRYLSDILKTIRYLLKPYDDYKELQTHLVYFNKIFEINQLFSNKFGLGFNNNIKFFIKKILLNSCAKYQDRLKKNLQEQILQLTNGFFQHLFEISRGQRKLIYSLGAVLSMNLLQGIINYSSCLILETHQPDIWRSVIDQLNLQQILSQILDFSNKCNERNHIVWTIEEDLDKIQKENAKLSNKELANNIFEYLQKRYDWLNFAVFIYDPIIGFEHHTGMSSADNIIHQFRDGGKNSMIFFKQKTWNKDGQQQIKLISDLLNNEDKKNMLPDMCKELLDSLQSQIINQFSSHQWWMFCIKEDYGILFGDNDHIAFKTDFQDNLYQYFKFRLNKNKYHLFVAATKY